MILAYEDFIRVRLTFIYLQESSLHFNSKHFKDPVKYFLTGVINKIQDQV
jgi:hypothetical protein